MGIENDNPNAQGPQTGADGQAQATTPAPQAAGFANEGFQKRIDELTARFHDAERRREAEVGELRQMNQQLLMAMAQGQTHQQYQQQPSVPQVEIDPDMKRQLDAYTQPLLQQQQAQFAQLMAQQASQQLAIVTQGQHPEVAKKTMAVWQDAVARGHHLKGFTPNDALVWARGQLVDLLVQEAQKGQQVQQGQQFNARPQVIPSQSAVAPTPGTQQVAEPDLDDDPEAASALFAKRLQGKTF